MTRRPLYWRLLALRHVRPNAWQRALLGEGALALAVVLVLADLATAWTLLVLPLAVGAFVKLHDVVAGLLAPRAAGCAALTAPQDHAVEREAGHRLDEQRIGTGLTSRYGPGTRTAPPR